MFPMYSFHKAKRRHLTPCSIGLGVYKVQDWYKLHPVLALTTPNSRLWVLGVRGDGSRVWHSVRALFSLYR